MEAAKQKKSIVLTTHSMEEADILGDKIGIMARGRLRCIGNSVHLKHKFGKGYKISVSCEGSISSTTTDNFRGVRHFFEEHLGICSVEESETYLHFRVPINCALMANFLSLLEAQKLALGIIDIQISLSSLEDVFLNLAKACELEDAQRNQASCDVALPSGQRTNVLIGFEGPVKLSDGTAFTIEWGPDENGMLIPVETREVEIEEHTVELECPEIKPPDHKMSVMIQNSRFDVAIPPGVSAGQKFTVTIETHVPKTSESQLAQDKFATEVCVTDAREELQARVTKLHTPYRNQANALFNKNLAFQKKRRITNICLLVVPILVLGVVFAIQELLEVFFLGTSAVRCPYCGPADDDYGKFYCNNAASCVDFFFPNSSRQALKNQFGFDVVARCEILAGIGPNGKSDAEFCYGGGNSSCFQTKWASETQFEFCPFKAGTIPTQPIFGSSPLAASRALKPVKITSDLFSRQFAFKIGNKSGTREEEILPKMTGVMRELNHQLFSLMFEGRFGCKGRFVDESTEFPQALCQLLQHGTDSSDVCCIDFTGNDSLPGDSQDGIADWRDGGLSEP